VDLALSGGATEFGMSREAYRRITRPQVDQDRQQTCVTLSTYLGEDEGSYRGCYDRHTRVFISSRTSGYSFRAERLWDYVGPWLW